MKRETAENSLQVRNLRLSYTARRGDPQQVLDISHLAVESGNIVGFSGPSGAGKTTLLYVLTGIETPDSGTICWGGTTITGMSENVRDHWRRRHVGFVFQDFYLFEALTPVHNVLLPSSFDRIRPHPDQRQHALALLADFGIPAANKDVSVMARGERQRVAIARALLHTPEIIVVDEPTASLDREAGAAVIDILLDCCREHGTTLLAVSHDKSLLDRMDKVHHLVGGRLLASEAGAA